jgi:hypothetical protein
MTKDRQEAQATGSGPGQSAEQQAALYGPTAGRAADYKPVIPSSLAAAIQAGRP